MNLNQNISTQVGITIIAFLTIALIALILFSWNWAGDYLASMVSSM